MILEKILDLLSRISTLYNIPQWIVDSCAIAICIILIASPFVARYLMRPKYYKYREMFLFKVLWRWKYKKGDVISLWCYCPNCQGMLICDDENCRSTTTLQDKITYFVCNECGGNELGRVVGGDRRYVLSLVKRDIWRHIKDGTYNEVSVATKDALELYQELKSEKEKDLLLEIAQSSTQEEPLHVKSDETTEDDTHAIDNHEVISESQDAQEGTLAPHEENQSTPESLEPKHDDETTADATLENDVKEEKKNDGI